MVIRLRMHNGVADPSRNPQGGGSCQAETGLAAYVVTVTCVVGRLIETISNKTIWQSNDYHCTAFPGFDT